jgi:DNA-binding MarR family transcriptional regulator
MDYKYDALKLEHQLCFRLYSVSRNMTRLYSELLDEFGLTYPQYIVMLVMFEHGEMDFKELSQMVDLKTGTMTPIIKKLEELGFVSRIRNEEDGRRLNVKLTEQGKELKEKIVIVPVELVKRLEMDIEDYKILIGQLDQLNENINAAKTR